MFDLARKLFRLFDSRERRNAVALIFLVLIMGVLETVSVASIMPFLSVVARPQIIQENIYLASLYGSFSFRDVDQFLFYLGTGIFVLVLLGLLIKGATYWALSRFVFMRNHALSYRLFKAYLSHPYEFFLSRHSGDLGKAILNEVHQLTITILQPALMLVANLSTSIFLVVLIVWVKPEAAAVAIGAIGTSYGIVYLLMRKRMAQIGYARVKANEQRFRIAQEAFAGVKEVKAAGLENEFVQRFQTPSIKMSRYLVSNMITGELPRYAIEAVTVGLVLAIILVQLAVHERGVQSLIPVLGVYAFAGMRLIPALQQIYRATVKLRFGKPALDLLYDDFVQAEAAPLSPQSVLPEKGVQRDDKVRALPVYDQIELRDTTYCYPGATNPALDDVTLVIPAQTTVAFVGSTGSGKTTAVDVILGLLQPLKGQLLVDDVAISADNVRQWQANVGYVPQHVFIADDTVAANIAFGVPRKEIDMAAVERAARVAEIDLFIRTHLPSAYETEVGERGVRLSGGQIQRLGIARALYHDPDVLVLDESTSALDNLTEKSVMDSVHNLSHTKTVILIAHRLSTVRACDKVFVLDQGMLSGTGTYDELMRENESFRRIAMAEDIAS